LTGLPYTTSRIADFTFNSQSKQDLTAELDLTHQRYCGIDPQGSERRGLDRGTQAAIQRSNSFIS